MPNRQIYDTVFRDYFNHPPRLLSLCNAVLRTRYSDPADVRINTLEGAFFSNIKLRAKRGFALRPYTKSKLPLRPWLALAKIS